MISLEHQSSIRTSTASLWVQMFNSRTLFVMYFKEKVLWVQFWEIYGMSPRKQRKFRKRGYLLKIKKERRVEYSLVSVEKEGNYGNRRKDWNLCLIRRRSPKASSSTGGSWALTVQWLLIQSSIKMISRLHRVYVALLCLRIPVEEWQQQNYKTCRTMPGSVYGQTAIG